MALLQEESELDEIVRLVGIDALSFHDRLTLESTRSIREDYLHQNAYHEVDTYASPKKQYLMLKAIHAFYEKSLSSASGRRAVFKLVKLPVREKIGRLKYVPEDEVQAQYNDIMQDLTDQIRALTEGGEAHA